MQVSIEWLNDCAKSQAKEDPDAYLISSASAANGNAKGKKRAASPEPSPEPDKTKKTKVEKEEPKFGEGSVLKSRDTLIPVDEECPRLEHR